MVNRCNGVGFNPANKRQRGNTSRGTDGRCNAFHENPIQSRGDSTVSHLIDSRTFQIESVKNWDERGIFLEILAKEVTT